MLATTSSKTVENILNHLGLSETSVTNLTIVFDGSKSLIKVIAECEMTEIQLEGFSEEFSKIQFTSSIV